INYVRYITQSCKYFFHMNHEIYSPQFSDDKHGMLGYEYPIPPDKFKILFRYPDMGHIFYQGFSDDKVDIFLYLYEKISSIR
ncbi:MAG TPA: hypothetical protein VED67_03345, partial [Thermodesulfovibrionales bacterium]|nr:hypothetical protein [Thermodesulfovibrionales bacterium]